MGSRMDDATPIHAQSNLLTIGYKTFESIKAKPSLKASSTLKRNLALLFGGRYLRRLLEYVNLLPPPFARCLTGISLLFKSVRPTQVSLGHLYGHLGITQIQRVIRENKRQTGN